MIKENNSFLGSFLKTGIFKTLNKPKGENVI